MGLMQKVSQVWRVKDIRKRILFVLGLLIVFRIAAHIPVPGVDVEALKQFFDSNQVLGLLNLFSGGAMANFSIVMLGVAPYITASIIFQLLTMIIPKLEEIQRDGEAGRAKINQWQRYLTIPLAALQAYSMIIILSKQGQGIINIVSPIQWLSTIITITAGTVFLMWLGELITEKNIGNGISLIIFAGIVARYPTQLQQTMATFDATQVITLIIFATIAILTIAGVVLVTQGQRNIPVSYAKRIRGNRMYGGVSTHLPLKVNQAGVIPIIFAISIILIPPMVAQWLVNSNITWLASLANTTVNLFNNQIFYSAIYFTFVVAFTYFYTAVVFHPDQISENLQKQGGFVPGIRPGRNTAEFLSYTSSRILLTGALFLGIIAVLPYIMQATTNITTFAIGGTSLLIVVSVVIETVKQVESQLIMRDYEGF
ncbi:MAG: preprotein translocase subunit SecY [Patescibacteria group bacterium]